jgi:hypothetical protein
MATATAQTSARASSPPPSLRASSAPVSPGKFAGTWLLNGTDRSTRFVFNKNGTFAYSGWGATSRGNWRYDGQSVHLVWTEIDKQKVAAGKVKKSYSVTPAGELVIDKYKYRRSG